MTVIFGQLTKVRNTTLIFVHFLCSQNRVLRLSLYVYETNDISSSLINNSIFCIKTPIIDMSYDPNRSWSTDLAIGHYFNKFCRTLKWMLSGAYYGSRISIPSAVIMIPNRSIFLSTLLRTQYYDVSRPRLVFELFCFPHYDHPLTQPIMSSFSDVSSSTFVPLAIVAGDKIGLEVH